MESVGQLLEGFAAALTPTNLLLALIGVLIGTITGVLPGVGPVGAIAILLGISPSLGPTGSVILFAGVYYGSTYGGSTTSILLNMPGEANSIVTAIDGYEMTKRGRAGAALSIAAIGSFVAGTISIIALSFAAPLLGDFALQFGPPEYFALAAGGLILLTMLVPGRPWKSIVMIFLGLLLGTVGIDTMSGSQRFTFGSGDLVQGLGIVPLAMGLFGISEVLAAAASRGQRHRVRAPGLRELLPTRSEARRSVGPIARGSVIGFGMGLIPGPATLTSTFASYVLEKRLSRRPEEFGKGAIEGVAGPEAANNAAAGAAFLPLLSLGIPFTPVMALVLSSLLLNGIIPGPDFIEDHGDIFWTVIASMYIGNLVLLVLNLPLVGLFTRILMIPQHYLLAVIILFSLVGVYADENSMWDVLVMSVAGLVAFWLRRHGFSMAPLLLAVVLGTVMENSFRQTMTISGGSFAIFLDRPIIILITSSIVLGLGLRIWFAARTRTIARRAERRPAS